MPITEEQHSYIKYIDSLTNKQLIEICQQEGVKQTAHGVSNKYVKKLNILTKYLNCEAGETEFALSVLLMRKRVGLPAVP